MKRNPIFDTFASHTCSFACLLALICLSHSPVLAQRSHMIGVGVGTVYYYGDLSDVFVSSNLKPAGTLTYQKYITEKIAFRGGFSVGQIASTDALADDRGRVLRDLNFKSTLVEAQTVMVYEFLQDKNFGSGLSPHHLSPYVFGGMGLFYFNPKRKLNGEWTALQPLGTEGQFLEGGKGPYSRFQISFPAGIGINARLTSNTGLSAEVGYRLTMTDYLDDVSTTYPDFDAILQQGGSVALQASSGNQEGLFQPGDKRGNPEKNDGYLFMTFSFNYYLERFK